MTSLEVIQANRSIHILCSGDATIQLSDLLRRIWENGSIDLALFFGSLGHLFVLPREKSTIRRGIREADHLLSQRHATRPGNEAIIWALLNNNPSQHDDVDLWSCQKHVQTAFLMSSAPCIRKSPGYSCAPANPVIKPVRRNININNRPYHIPVKYHHGYDGKGSWVGTITANDLWSQWLFIDMTPDALRRYEENYNTYSKSTNVAEMLEGSPGSEEDLDFPPESLLPDWLDIDVSCRTIEGRLQARSLFRANYYQLASSQGR